VIRNIKLTPALVVKIALDSALAMSFLHNNGVIHRDLKPSNVLMVSFSMSAEVCVKLADFGTSKSVNHIYQRQMHTNGWGTPGYMAPELFDRSDYCGKVDVYAFGVMLLELLTQKDPWGFLKHQWDLADFILKGSRPHIPDTCPIEYANIITRCWDQDPKKQASIHRASESVGTTLPERT